MQAGNEPEEEAGDRVIEFAPKNRCRTTPAPLVSSPNYYTIPVTLGGQVYGWPR
jgi:hypothetical protein